VANDAAFPDHAILGEESGASEGSSCRWVIDPLDGTTNFYHGLPHFGISIAVENAGEPLLGVLHVTPAEDRYLARVDEGAFRNGNRISVSGAESLDTTFVGTGFPPGPAESSLLDTFAAALDVSHGIRRIGSAVEDFGLVAEDRLNAYFHAFLSPMKSALPI